MELLLRFLRVHRRRHETGSLFLVSDAGAKTRLFAGSKVKLAKAGVGLHLETGNRTTGGDAVDDGNSKGFRPLSFDLHQVRPMGKSGDGIFRLTSITTKQQTK